MIDPVLVALVAMLVIARNKLVKGASHVRKGQKLTSNIMTMSHDTMSLMMLYLRAKDVARLDGATNKKYYDARDTWTIDSRANDLSDEELHTLFTTLPRSLKTLWFAGGFNRKLNGNTRIPEGVRHIGFVAPFNKLISAGVIPSSVERIEFDRTFNCPLYDSLRHLPNLRHLEFGDDFNQPIDGKLPDCLEVLLLHTNSNLPITTLPTNLKHLFLGCKYNQPLPRLPEKLTHLDLGYAFNQPINVGDLPNGLLELKFPYGYYQLLVNGLFPETLETLEFGYFNQPLEQGFLPKSLNNLEINYGFNHPLNKNSLPNSIEDINLGDSFDQPLTPNMLPKNLVHVKIGNSFSHPLVGVLPESVRSVYISTLNPHYVEERQHYIELKEEMERKGGEISFL